MVMSQRSPSQRYRNVPYFFGGGMMMTMMMMVIGCFLRMTTIVVEMMTTIMIVSAWECPSLSIIVPKLTHSSSLLPSLLLQQQDSIQQQQQQRYNSYQYHPSQQHRCTVNTRMNLFKSPSDINESTTTTTTEILVSIPSKIIPPRILQHSIRFRSFFIRRPGININHNTTTTTTGSSSNMDHTPSFISSLTTDKFVMIHRMDDDKKKNDDNKNITEDISTTESILPKWMMMRQQSPTEPTLQNIVTKEKEEKEEKDIQQQLPVLLQAPLPSKQQQQHIGSSHSSSSSFKIQMTEDEKQKFLNASLQSYNIHIPSLLFWTTTIDSRMVDVVVNNNNTVIMEKKGMMTMTTNHHVRRHDHRDSPFVNTTATTASTLTQQSQPPPTKERLQSPPIMMMNQNELEQQWIDRILNRNLPISSRNNNNNNQNGIINTAATPSVTSNQPALSPSMRWNDAGRLPIIPITNITSSKSAKDIYWENRRAIDMVQQRLIHMTKMNSSSGIGSMNHHILPAVDSVDAIPISSPTTNITIPVNNRNRSFIQQDQPRSMNNNIRNDSIPHTEVVVPTIITPMRIEVDRVNTVPSSSINNYNKNTMNHEFQRRKPQPSIPSSTLSNQKKKIRMEIPMMEQQQPDESKDMSNPNNLHDVRRLTTTPTNENNDPNDVVTPTTTKQQLDRAKMWGIDMSKFQ